MSRDSQPNEIVSKRVVLTLPGMDEVTISRDIVYGVVDSGVLTMDAYYPPRSNRSERRPAVVFVSGYSDAGFQRMLGCKLKEMGSYISWAQLIAVSGIAAIVYSALEPATDIHSLLAYVRENAVELGIDENRIGLWACSGNVPNALAVLMEGNRDYLKCAALCYGMMLDLDGHRETAESAKMVGFVNPSAGKSVEDLSSEIPLYIARAGQDTTPHLNETLDRFVSKALSRNLPITLTNHRSGPHAFDTMQDSPASREVIRQILAFMRAHLLA